ncbi:MAG: nickel/cobalt transporter [Bradyrhizobiaceae bacterium]|nr:nickel/cobalt transporter [Bradyrhizobiaceae bacterium]
MKALGSKEFARAIVVTTFIVALAFVVGSHPAWSQIRPYGDLASPATGGIAGWVLEKQAMFYRSLSGMIRLAKSDGTAIWGLMGISFLYGIFHAAGPGHGKALISSYLVANEETWRRGITLSFASAVMQSLTAVAIVSVAAVMLGATAKLMGETVRIIEIVSYGLIILLGARLLWVKGRGFISAVHAYRTNAKFVQQEPCQRGASDHPRQNHHHSHDHSTREYVCNHGHDADDAADFLPGPHVHGPEPEALAGPGGWRRGWEAIVAVGLRPCSGAIIVLVFALAQGLFWAGIASTFVMGLGTAITVAAIATLAVGAKGVAKRFAGNRVGYGSLFLRGVEVGGAVLVLLVGVLLLTGYMASERLLGF